MPENAVVDEREKREIILPISGVKAVIREGDGYSDLLLLRRNKKFPDVIFDYLASLTVSLGDKKEVKADDIKGLLTPDQEFLSVECYKMNYGDNFEFEFICPKCGDESDQSVSLKDMKFQNLPKGIKGPDPTIEVALEE